MENCKFKATTEWLMIHESILAQVTTHGTVIIRV